MVPLLPAYLKITGERELPDRLTPGGVADFLHRHLERFGDDRASILRALEYAFSGESGKGGFIILARRGEELIGCAVVNRTGMSGYIPENYLVYVATDSGRAPLGTGAELVRRVLDECEGDVALHVEPDNAARHLYAALGFEEKYVEMRWKRPPEGR
ncbi:MAG TPA: N-acetyltransferase [Candidatus Coatesbacteria bacterium]|nr:N-acetyltransferase [Candidatus Coatesbacteria bacterium]